MGIELCVIFIKDFEEKCNLDEWFFGIEAIEVAFLMRIW